MSGVRIRGRAKWREAELERLCVSAGNGWSLGARGGAEQAWLSRSAGDAWGAVAVTVLGKKIISCCLERWPVSSWAQGLAGSASTQKE